MVRRKKTARLSCVAQWSIAAPAVASGNSSPSSDYGNSSLSARRRRVENECPEETNLEKGEDTAMKRPEDSSERDAEAHLEWWEVAEREAEEAEFEAAEAMAAVREAEKAE